MLVPLSHWLPQDPELGSQDLIPNKSALEIIHEEIWDSSHSRGGGSKIGGWMQTGAALSAWQVYCRGHWSTRWGGGALVFKINKGLFSYLIQQISNLLRFHTSLGPEICIVEQSCLCWRKCSRPALSTMLATIHMQLLSTWDMANVTGGKRFLILSNHNLNS